MSSFKQLGRLRLFPAPSKYVSIPLSKYSLAAGVSVNYPTKFVGQKQLFLSASRHNASTSKDSPNMAEMSIDELGGLGLENLVDIDLSDMSMERIKNMAATFAIKKGISKLKQFGKTIMWGKEKGIKIVIDESFDINNDSDTINNNNNDEKRSAIFELTEIPSHARVSASEVLWENLLTKVYDKIETISNDALPLITYEYENKVHVINSVESMSHFITRFKILNKIKQGIDGQWDDVPTLYVIKLDIQDGTAHMPINDDDEDSERCLEAKKFVQTTLGGNGNCLVLLGKTGVGKSSLANALLGFHTEKGPFATSSAAYSCTKDLSQFSGFEIGDNGNQNKALLTVIDTPGFSDSDGQDDELFEKAYDFFKRLYYGPNLFVLCLDIENPRYDDTDRISLKFLYKMFGNDFPKHLIIAFTKCDPDKRNLTRGWGKSVNQLKEQYRTEMATIMDGQKPLALCAVSADDNASLTNIINIIRDRDIGRYSSKRVQSIKTLKEEDAKAEMKKYFQEVISQLQDQLGTLQSELKSTKADLAQARSEARNAQDKWCSIM